MKEGWKKMKLGEVCDFQNGFAFKSNLFADKGIGVVRISDIQNGEVSKEKMTYVNPKSIKEDLSSFIVRPNDILIAMSGGTTGKLGINKTNETFFQNQRVGLFREHKEVLNHTFLYYFLCTKSEESLKIAAGAAQPNLSTIQIKQFQIPVPPLPEQQRIVSYLDAEFAKIEALKANAEKQLQAAKDLFQSALKDLMTPKEGWEEKKLGEVCLIKSGYAFKSGTFTKDGFYQIIRMGNVRPGLIRYDESPIFLPKDCDDKILNKSHLNIGDVIITLTGTRHKRDYGYTTIIDRDNLLLNQRLASIRASESLSNKFLLYYTWTDTFKDQFFENEGGAVGQGNVGMDAIKKSSIRIPSICEQEFIVAKLDDLSAKAEQLQTNYEQTITLCNDLKQALLKKVFE